MTTLDVIRNYLGNRIAFYEALLPRIPEPGLRERIRDAADMSRLGEMSTASAALGTSPVDDRFFDGLKTLDLLKNQHFGAALGRTTISVSEALNRAAQIEIVGILLFGHLGTAAAVQGGEHFVPFMDRHKQSLANLLLLHDGLRYHRIVPLASVREDTG